MRFVQEGLGQSRRRPRAQREYSPGRERGTSPKGATIVRGSVHGPDPSLAAFAPLLCRVNEWDESRRQLEQSLAGQSDRMPSGCPA